MLGELKEIAQLGGTVVTVVLFLFYLNKKDERSKKTYDQFNSTINSFNTTMNNHMDHSTKAINENTKAMTKVAVYLKESKTTIKFLNKKNV